MKQKTKKSIKCWSLIILFILLNGLIIGVIAEFVPDIIYIGGVPFAILYVILTVVFLLLYKYIIRTDQK